MADEQRDPGPDPEWTPRMRPPLGPDNAWWWEQAAEGRLVLQRCTACAKLRHPPRPMCDGCRSMGWDFVESPGRGVVHSYTVLRYPEFPGHQYPIVCALVALEEGQRMVATLDCSPDDVAIGMPVEAYIHEDPDGFRIPYFRPA